MHPDHDTAARLARTWSRLRDAQPGETKMLTGVEPATLAALLEGYAERERMRGALELYACAGRPRCSAPMLKDGSCVHDLGPGACGAHALAALPSAREGNEVKP